MRTAQISGATSAPFPPPDALQRSRVLARVNLSPSLAGVVAGLAFGAGRRDDCSAVWTVTASRCGAAAGVRQ